MKIDVHCHILPRQWPDLAERYGYGEWVQLLHHGPGCRHVSQDRAHMMKGGQFFREVEANLWDADARLADCTEHSVDVQVLSTVPVMFSYWAEAKDTADLARILNDDMAAFIAEHPKRFVGLGTVPMQAPDLAIAEMRRCREELGFAGIEIGTHIEHWNLDDPALEPVWQAAEALDLAVFVHPWDMMGMDRMPRHWLPWLVSMPAETSLAICSLTMGGVLDRYPGLRFLFAHGGGSFPATIGRIDHGHAVRPDLCQSHTTRPPSAYLDRLYLDSLVHDPRMLAILLDRFGAERVALGTDYPFPLGELQPGQLIESRDELAPSVKEQLLSGTALEWLRLRRQDYETEASLAHSRDIGLAV